MTDFNPQMPIIALTLGGAATLIWAVVLVRSVVAWRSGVEHRLTFVVMAGAALIASIGTLASSIGFAMQRGVLQLDIDPELLSVIASMGRGALFAAGLIVITHYRPPRVLR